MIKNILFEKVVEGIKNLPNGSKLTQDVEDNLKAVILSVIKKLDIVTREEFDVQQKVLLATRKKLDEIEQLLNTLVK